MKIMKIKRIFALLLVAIMLFTVAGCKNGDTTEITSEWYEDDPEVGGDVVEDGENNVNDAQGDSTPSGVTDSDGEKAQPITDPYANIPTNLRGTTVKFATWIDHKSNESASVLKKFTAKTGINVELVNIPQEGYMSKLVSMIASDQAPDVFVDNYEFPVSLKVAQPLNSYINLKDPVWDTNIKKMSTVDGKTFLVNGAKVHWNFVQGLMFQKSIAEDNGIKTPYDYRDEGNWNWDTLKQFMMDYNNIPGDYWGGYLDPEIVAVSAGSGLVMYDINKGTFSSGIGSSGLTKAYQFYLGLKKNDNLADNSHYPFIVEGQQAVCTFSNWQFTKSAINWEKLDLSKIGFIEFPNPAGSSKKYYYMSTRSYGICRNAKNAKGAGYFLRFFLDADNYDVNEVYKNPEIAVEMVERVRKANSKMTPMLYISDEAMNLVNSTLWSDTMTELKATDPNQISGVLKGKEGVMKNAAAKANSTLKSVK